MQVADRRRLRHVLTSPFTTGQSGPCAGPRSAQPPYLQTRRPGSGEFSGPGLTEVIPSVAGKFLYPAMTLLVCPPGYTCPYAQDWNVNIQRGRSARLAVPDRNVGTHGVRLPALHSRDPTVYFPGHPQKQCQPVDGSIRVQLDRATAETLAPTHPWARSPASRIRTITPGIQSTQAFSATASRSWPRIRIRKSIDDVSSINITGSAPSPSPERMTGADIRSTSQPSAAVDVDVATAWC